MEKQKKTLDWFTEKRIDQYKTASDIETHLQNGCLHIIVDAPVKSGKREIAECVAMLYVVDGNKKPIEHIFITSLALKDSKVQHKELEENGFKNVFVITNPKQKRNFEQRLDRNKTNKITTVIHFDELDYGSGTNNKMAGVFKKIKGLDFPIIYYSATPEELLNAINPSNQDKFETVKFNPSSDYIGAKGFLNANKVRETFLFFLKKDDEWNFSDKTIELLDEWKNSNKAFGVLRLGETTSEDELSYRDFEKHRQLKRRFLKEDIELKFIDAKNSFDWENDWKNLLNEFQKEKIRTLFVVLQTATRSTEWKFHEHLFFSFDYRTTDKSNYATKIQAIGRVFHYKRDDSPWIPWVYADKEIFEYAAGMITKEDYKDKLAARINSKTIGGERYSDDPSDYYIKYSENIPKNICNKKDVYLILHNLYNQEKNDTNRKGFFTKNTTGPREDFEKHLLYDEENKRWMFMQMSMGKDTSLEFLIHNENKYKNVNNKFLNLQTKAHSSYWCILLTREDGSQYWRIDFHNGNMKKIETTTNHETAKTSMYYSK